MTFINWLKSKNITTHSVVVLFGTLALAYGTSPQLQAMVKAFLATHPQISALVSFAIAAFAAYKNSQKVG